MWNINIAAAKRHTDNLREEVKKGYTEKLAQGWLPEERSDLKDIEFKGPF